MSLTPLTPLAGTSPPRSLTLVRHTAAYGDPDPAPVPPPPPGEGLTYSFTLPAALSTPAVARHATARILTVHRIPELSDAALQTVGELTATACRLTTAPQIYLALRYRSDALRVIVYDGEPRPTHARLLEALDARRRAALRLLARVVRSCGGTWGYDESPDPSSGTRMWAVLPHGPTAAYNHATAPAPRTAS
ncbi:ATP-binding protein [Streptomyces sp. KLOTTS4A1]|uniref:ATP-binding protein n=1 Tax=Streptomyces sp. KLOTTS4A1 TaxID=3390996 RepID=UPI0039F4E929